jgi:hypothetical protein
VSFMDRFASAATRRAAAEEARHTVIKHGENAERVLCAKAEQTRDSGRRRVYRLAAKVLRQG